MHMMANVYDRLIHLYLWVASKEEESPCEGVSHWIKSIHDHPPDLSHHLIVTGVLGSPWVAEPLGQLGPEGGVPSLGLPPILDLCSQGPDKLMHHLKPLVPISPSVDCPMEGTP